MARNGWKVALLTVMVSVGAIPVAQAAPIDAGMPSDVEEYVERAEACTFWIDADIYDDDDGALEQMRELECGRLDADEARLRRKYIADDEILDLLDSVGELGC